MTTRATRLSVFAAVALLAAQLILLLLLDPLIQVFNHRVGPRYVPEIAPFGTLLLPVAIIAGLMFVAHRSLVVPPQTEANFSRWEPHFLLAGLALVVLAPHPAIAWAVLFVTLWLASQSEQPERSGFLAESRNIKVLVLPILGASLLVGVILRIANLVALGPATDANLHLLKAISDNYGVEFDYRRADVVTETLRLAFAVLSPETFNQHLFAARIPGVLLGAATAIPIYFIAKTINFRVGLIAAALWSIHPFSISISRYIREYVYFSFSATVLFSVGLGLVLRWRGKLVRQLLAAGSITVVMFRYAAWDSLSTYRVNAVFTAACLLLIVLALGYIDSESRIRPQQLLASGLALGALSGAVFRLVGRDGSLSFALGQPGIRLWEYYADGMSIIRPQSGFVILVAGLVSMAFIWAEPPGRAVIFGLSASSAAAFLGLVNFWDRWDSPHYTVFVLPTMVIVLAVTLDVALQVFRSVIRNLPMAEIQKRIMGISAAIVLLPASLGVPAIGEILLTLRSPEPRLVGHWDSRLLVSHLQSLPEQKEFAVWSTSLQVTALLSGLNFSFDDRYEYTNPERHRKIIEATKQKTSGIIAIDQGRVRWTTSLPMADFLVVSATGPSICVRYEGQFGDFHLWTWGDSRPNDCYEAVRLDEWLTISE